MCDEDTPRVVLEGFEEGDETERAVETVVEGLTNAGFRREVIDVRD